MAGKTAMALLGDLLRQLSAAALGIFLGSQLTEGLVLVPYWRALPADEFLRWYAANDARLLRYFGPLTSVTALLAVAAAVVSWQEGHAVAAAFVPAGVMVAIVAGFFLYFDRANKRFAAGTIAAPAVAGELARWSAWHWTRTVLAGIAFAAALAAA
jgi:hypothetical protein